MFVNFVGVVVGGCGLLKCIIWECDCIEVVGGDLWMVCSGISFEVNFWGVGCEVGKCGGFELGIFEVDCVFVFDVCFGVFEVDVIVVVIVELCWGIGDWCWCVDESGVWCVVGWGVLIYVGFVFIGVRIVIIIVGIGDCCVCVINIVVNDVVGYDVEFGCYVIVEYGEEFCV